MAAKQQSPAAAGQQAAAIPFHSLPAEAVCTELETDGTAGLSEAEASTRLAEYGRNVLTEAYKPSFLRRLWSQVNNIIIWILIIAAVISAILQDWAELVLIALVVVVNVAIGLIQEGKAERAAEALKAMLAPRATVIRGGSKQGIDSAAIVPGDLCFFQSGDRIPADCRLLSTANLSIQEAMLTGESLPVTKKLDAVPPEAALGDRKCMAFSGTLVMSGQGVGVVTATGDQAELGKINSLVAGQEEPPTPILVQLELFGRFVAVCTIILAVVAFLIVFLGRGIDAGEAFLVAVAIAVAIIPEGLPSIVTVTLALGVQNMAKQKAIIRKLPAVETLGAVTVICSDKTGTLTKNEMTVVGIHTSGALYKVQGVGYQPDNGSIVRIVGDKCAAVMPGIDTEAGAGAAAAFQPCPPEEVASLKTVLLTGVLCNDGGLKAPGSLPAVPGDGGAVSTSTNAKDGLQLREVQVDVASAPASEKRSSTAPVPYGGWTISGDPTDVALLTVAMKAGVADIGALQGSAPRCGVVPFESDHKFQVTLHKDAGDGHIVAHVKGAPERLIPRCAYQLSPGSALDVMSTTSRVPIDQAWWQAKVQELSAQGLRVLAYCRADLPAAMGSEDWSNISVADVTGQDAAAEGGGNAGATIHEGGPSKSARLGPYLTITSLVAILDPPRPECIQAIATAHHAGIVVKMITGDHRDTALAIGKALGIAKAGDAAYTGPELDRMDDTTFADTVMACNVFARASPENKIRIVKALQSRGQVTSMTGDGVNDAPALKAANIGVAMGITGTDVSKEAAKMVLADDNFTSIISAVKEGRHVWANLVKILMFTLPTNMSQGLIVLFAYILDMETSPLTAMQVLYVNMITSITSGVALAFEPTEPHIMQDKPRSPKKRLLSKTVLWRTLYVTIILVVFVLGTFQWSLNIGYDVSRARSSAMTTLVVAQCFYLLNCRFNTMSALHPRVFKGNKWVWVAILVNLALQCLLVYTPGVQEIFDTGFMNGFEWLRCLMFGAVLFLIVEAEKVVGPRYIWPVVLPALRALDRVTPRVVLGWPWKYKDKQAAAAAGVPATETRPDFEGPVPVAFIATSASTFGYPTRPQPLSRSLSNALGLSTRTRSASATQGAANVIVSPLHVTNTGRAGQGLAGHRAATSTRSLLASAPVDGPYPVASGLAGSSLLDPMERHIARYASGRGSNLLSQPWIPPTASHGMQIAVHLPPDTLASDQPAQHMPAIPETSTPM